MGSLKVVTAYYDLAQADNRVMVEWLLRPRQKPPRSLRHALADLIIGRLFRATDVRYTLAEMLHSSAMRSAFDLVIIDCPPRLTTSEMQAFCAATHLLIPTIFDRPSAEAVVSLANQIETLKGEGICPHLQYVGVVGTKWKANFNAQQAELAFLTQQLAGNRSGLAVLHQDNFVPMTVQIVENADQGIAYIMMPDNDRVGVREAIETLARTIAGQMGLPIPLAMAAAPQRQRNGA